MWLASGGFLSWRFASIRVGMIDRQAIRQRWECVGTKLDEWGQRLFVAGEVRAAGWGARYAKPGRSEGLVTAW